MMVLLLKSFLKPTAVPKRSHRPEEVQSKDQSLCEEDDRNRAIGRVSKCCVEIRPVGEFTEDLFFLNQVFSDQRLGALICDLFFNIL